MQVADLERLLSQSRLATYYQFFSYDGKYTKNLFLNQPSRQKKSRSYDRLQLKIKKHEINSSLCQVYFATNV